MFSDKKNLVMYLSGFGLICHIVFSLLQSAWMEHYLAIIGIVGMGQEQIVGSFNWRFVRLDLKCHN